MLNSAGWPVTAPTLEMYESLLTVIPVSASIGAKFNDTVAHAAPEVAPLPQYVNVVAVVPV